MWTVCLNPLCVHQARCIEETQRKTGDVHKKKRSQQSKPQTVTGHGNSGCTRSAVLTTYYLINWAFREGRPQQNVLLLFMYETPNKNLKKFSVFTYHKRCPQVLGFVTKPHNFSNSPVPRLVFLSLWWPSNSHVYLPHEEQVHVRL